MRTFIIFALLIASWESIPAEGLVHTANTFVKLSLCIGAYAGIIMAIAQDIKELRK